MTEVRNAKVGPGQELNWLETKVSKYFGSKLPRKIKSLNFRLWKESTLKPEERGRKEWACRRPISLLRSGTTSKHIKATLAGSRASLSIPKIPIPLPQPVTIAPVKLWSIASPIPDSTIKAHNHFVNCVDFYRGTDKPYLITASSDRTVKLWDYCSQTCVQTMEGHTDGVLFAVYHPTLPLIISGGYDRTVMFWTISAPFDTPLWIEIR